APDLARGGDVAAHLEAGLALVGTDAYPDRDILGDIAAALSLAKDPLKRGQDLARHRPGHGLAQGVPECVHAWSRQVGKPGCTQMLLDMGAELPVLLQSGALELLVFAPLHPIGDGLGDGGAAARSGVGAGAHRGSHLGVVGGGVLLVFEAGDVALAVTAAVVNNPVRAGFSALGRPGAAADAHVQPLRGRLFWSRVRARVMS